MVENGFHPGSSFTPSLLSYVPPNELLYVGIKDGSSQWPQLDRAFTWVAGYGFSNQARSSQGSAPFVERLLSEYFRVEPSDVAKMGSGEQSWFFGDTVGAAFRPTNLAEAVSTAAAMTRRRFPYSGVTTGHDHGAVWIRNSTLTHEIHVPGPSPTTLVKRAELSHKVSLIVAVDLSPFTAAGAAGTLTSLTGASTG